MPGELLIIFVKAPRPGHVKTRIAELIGPQPACDTYVALVGILVGNLQSLPKVQVRYTPDDAFLEIPRWVQPTWTTAPQGQGTLGERLTRAFGDAFNAGAERVVIIGSDAPDVSRADIEEAWASLDEQDVVIGPAEDGGYWLIGLRAEQSALFDDILWSSNAVFAQTMERARAANLRVKSLRTIPDIDTLEDLRRFQARTASPA